MLRSLGTHGMPTCVAGVFHQQPPKEILENCATALFTQADAFEVVICLHVNMHSAGA